MATGELLDAIAKEYVDRLYEISQTVFERVCQVKSVSFWAFMEVIFS